MVGAAVLAVTLTAAAVYAVVTLSGASTPSNARNGYPGVAMPTHLRPVGLMAPAIAAGPSLPIGYTVNGIDVSSHDHDQGRAPDWAARKAGGDEFAYTRYLTAEIIRKTHAQVRERRCADAVLCTRLTHMRRVPLVEGDEPGVGVDEVALAVPQRVVTVEGDHLDAVAADPSGAARECHPFTLRSR